MYNIVQRFAEEFLGGEYEAVFAVHTDKDHLHSHLVFNSVNMINSRKYNYRKGDWKDLIQPITNRLCKEYGLSIVAAEYSNGPYAPCVEMVAGNLSLKGKGRVKN